MNNDFVKLIKKCRKNAHLTIEEAAFLLNTSTRNLYYYENGTSKVPDDMAVAMSRIYRNPLVKYAWLQNTRCAQAILPELGDKSLSENILDIMYVLDKMDAHSTDLIDIGRDNMIDDKERSLYEKIKQNCLLPLSRCVFALSFPINKKIARESSQATSINI